MQKKHTYITTTLPYVNSDPHIGFALELVQADIFARYRHLMGDNVFFNTGTDEHGQKVYQKAVELGRKPQEYVDEYAARFKKLLGAVGIAPISGTTADTLPDSGFQVNFIRTTDEHHKKAAQEFWKRCDAAGDIYKKNYKTKYCIGCELEKTDSELVDGKCPIHPNLTIEVIEEENYFFKFSRYQKPLLDLYAVQPELVVPDFRFNEIKNFVAQGLQDFSISRLKSKMSWGIEVPDDPDHVMYVWFDALVDYISALGWPESVKVGGGKNSGEKNSSGDFSTWWPVIQFAGKDQIRMQAAMWQAMLMSARSAQSPELVPSKQIVIHGFITSGGQKMSKSLGNVIDPFAIVEEYRSVTDFSADVLRYYLAREIHPFEDSDFTMEKFKEAYNANLANGLGNLVSRVMKMATSYGVIYSSSEKESWSLEDMYKEQYLEYNKFLDTYSFGKALDIVWHAIGKCDRLIQTNQPFKVFKTDPEKAKEYVRFLVQGLMYISILLYPFLPCTSEEIKNCLLQNKMPNKPLFARKD